MDTGGTLRGLYSTFLTLSRDQAGGSLRPTTRVVLCILLLAIHYFLLFLPVSELFLIYILLFNPPWFRAFLNRAAPREEPDKTG